MSIIFEASTGPGVSYQSKTCEFCGRNFVREVPKEIKHGHKLCADCSAKPVLNQEYWNKLNAMDLYQDPQTNQRKQTRVKRESAFIQARNFLEGNGAVRTHKTLYKLAMESLGKQRSNTLKIISIFILCLAFTRAYAGTITGSITTATNGTVNNGTLNFTLSQPAVVSGTATIVTNQVSCYTDNSGSIRGVPDPIVAPVLSLTMLGSPLPTGTYLVKLTYVGAGGESNPSPESSIFLDGSHSFQVVPPVLQPASATSYSVYASKSPAVETKQLTNVNFQTYGQVNTALVAGAALPGANSSTCTPRFSDEMIPSGTNYRVNLLNKNGSQISGFPQTWCTFGGANGSINVSNGTPQGLCNVIYPTPILATPALNAQQSISGPLQVPQLKVVNTLSGSQPYHIRVGLDSNDLNGGYLFSYIPGATQSVVLSDGAYFNGTNFVATQTGAAGVEVDNGTLQFFNSVGLTPGNVFSPTVGVGIDQNANLTFSPNSQPISLKSFGCNGTTCLRFSPDQTNYTGAAGGGTGMAQLNSAITVQYCTNNANTYTVTGDANEHVILGNCKIANSNLANGHWYSGLVINISAYGKYTTINNTDTITVRIKLCTVSGCGSGTVVLLGASGAVNPGVVTAGAAARLEWQMLVQSYGVGTAVTFASGETHYSTGASTTVIGMIGDLSPTFDTRLDQYLQISIQNAVAGQSTTLDNIAIKMQ